MLPVPSQKKNLHSSFLATKLHTLTIPPANSDQDFDFSDVFGPQIPHPSSSPHSIWDPQVIHNRSHSFVGPSPRYTLSKTLPFRDLDDSDDDPDEELGGTSGIAQVTSLNAQGTSLNAQGSSGNAQGTSGNADGTSLNAQVTSLNAQGTSGNAQGTSANAGCTSVNDGSANSDAEGTSVDEESTSGNAEGTSVVGKCNMIGPGDFEIMRVVGKGAFGKVFQVRKRGGIWMGNSGGGDEGDGIFAMKVMRKDTIIKNNHVDYMRAERDILTKVVHPFVVQLRYSFQTKSKLYLILDFINGGHLFYHLYRQGIFSEDQARVYTAEIVSAVSHLHKNGIVHRDLKPETILMDADGHVMLTDFGLAKEIKESSRSNSLCGTTEYMAPEILRGKGHNKDADWWSVGILLYEMLTGKPPFTHSNRKKLQERIMNENVKLLPRLTSEVHSLLRGLLQKDPSKRLGSGPKGGDDIKSHKWFRSIKWKKLEAREIQPKFKPDINGEDCTANFDKCWTTMPLDDSPAPTPTAGEHFQGYTFVAPNPWLPASIEE